jgi:hypothetical protein
MRKYNAEMFYGWVLNTEEEQYIIEKMVDAGIDSDDIDYFSAKEFMDKLILDKLGNTNIAINIQADIIGYYWFCLGYVLPNASTQEEIFKIVNLNNKTQLSKVYKVLFDREPEDDPLVESYPINPLEENEESLFDGSKIIYGWSFDKDVMDNNLKEIEIKGDVFPFIVKELFNKIYVGFSLDGCYTLEQLKNLLDENRDKELQKVCKDILGKEFECAKLFAIPKFKK